SVQHGLTRRVGKRVAQVAAALDSELHEDLAEVVLDRARADEQLRADLGVRESVASQQRDLQFLGGQGVARVRGPAARGLTGRGQLAARPLRERFGPDAAEALVRGAQNLARVGATVLAPEPLAVHELTARELDGRVTAREPLDRLAVLRFVV